MQRIPMQLNNYLGFKTARQRNEAYQVLIKEIEDCKSTEQLNELWQNIEEFILRIKAELSENIPHWMNYETELLDHYQKYHFLLTQMKEFICY